MAFETKFGWILTGNTDNCKRSSGDRTPSATVFSSTSQNLQRMSSPDILCKFWEVEEKTVADGVLSPEERLVIRMCRGIELIPSDRDLHRFVWRKNQNEPISDFRMTRVMFGVSA